MSDNVSTYRIGIAGYMGAGKSECSSMLAEEGYSVVDADQLAKELMRENDAIRRNLRREFGEEVLKEDEIDFQVLGSTVFSDANQLKRLNDIVHPVLLMRMAEVLAGIAPDKPVVIDAALIPQWQIDNWFDCRIWVYASPELRLQRVCKKRPELPTAEIGRRIRMQERYLVPPSESTWSFIENDTDMLNLRRTLLKEIVLSRPGTFASE